MQKQQLQSFAKSTSNKIKQIAISTNSHDRKLQWQTFNKSLLRNRVKVNQIKFENKYRQQYNIQKKDKSPQLTTKANISQIQDNINISIVSLRKIIKEKHKQEDYLRKTLSQYNFHIAQKERTLRAFNIAKQKHRKIISIRQNHKRDTVQLNKNKIINQQQIQQEKQRKLSLIKYDKSQKSKSFEKSKIQKKNIADQIRVQLHQSKLKFYLTQIQNLQCLKKKCQMQKSQQKIKQQKILKVKQTKKEQANKMRKNKFYTQMNQRNIIYKQRVKFNSKTSKKINFIKTMTDNLNKKIKQYRLFSKEISSHKKSNSMSFSLQK